MTNPDVKHWIELHGIGIHSGPLGSAWAHIPIPCGALTPEGMCGLYGTSERPKMCGDGPVLLTDLVGIEKICTYSFVEADVETEYTFAEPEM